ncbi:MAG: exodeoxyribonuclease VII small subunit [Epulopiscium sp.]|nr:exodeoxyribonuclease VII small subunit [Candidatus Epulonipiscium sp.]
MTVTSKKKQTFEEGLVKLEEIIGQLEGGDLPLDKAFEYYKEGMDLSLFCQKELTRVEEEVSKIQKDQDGEFKISNYESEDL